jgi:hypothetical protein
MRASGSATVSQSKVVFILFTMLISIQVTAQRFTPIGAHIKRGPKTNFGMEASVGTRAFKMSSDIETINGMNVRTAGGSMGLTVGSKFYSVKLRQGFFSAAPTDAKKFNVSETSTVFNLYLFKLFNSRIKYFEPYIITSTNRSVLKYASTAQEPQGIYNGKVVNIHGNMGFGLEGHIPGHKHFANFFAELQYGVPLVSTNSSAFNNTKSSNVLNVNFGIGFGISR